MTKKEKKTKKTETSGQDIPSELYEGDVQLEIETSDGYRQVDQFKECLKKVTNLQIALNIWSEDEGLMTIVSLKSPVRLGKILSKMPIVQQVYKKPDSIVVVLNTSAADIPPVAVKASLSESPAS